MAISERKTAHHIEIREVDGVPAIVSVGSPSPRMTDVEEVMRLMLHEHPPEEPERQHVGPKSVLIVDDDPEALEEMTEAFEDYGLAVLPASDAAEALRLAEENRPRFIVMDFNLPEMNGLDAVTTMRGFLPNSTFIMISGCDDFCRVATTENTSTFAVLQKPVSIHSIARYVRNAFLQSGDKVLDATEMLTT